MNYSLFFYVLSGTLWVLTVSQSCLFKPRTYLKNDSLADVYLESDSKICEESKPSSPLSTCPLDYATVQFSSTAIIPNTTNVWPYIDLNITVIAHVFISDIFVQLECLHATNLENTYCHNRTIPIQKWGRMVWPCRQHTIKNEEDDVKLPFIFEHACFRMHGMSQYRINVTLHPQDCMLSYLVTVPMDRQLEPEIAQFFTGDKTTDIFKYPWSPMIAIDLNNPTGLGINFARRKSGIRGDVTIALYKMTSDSTSKEIFNEPLSLPKSSVIVGAPRGDYLVFVYVDDPHCKLHCPETTNVDGEDDNHCNVCPHTFLNFTLNDHKLNGLKSAWYTFMDVLLYIFYGIFGLLILISLIVFGFYIYVHVIRPRRLARLPPQNIEMTSRPDILIIYTDDTPEHTSCITALAELLQRHANAKVRIDVFDLNDPSIKPSMWLLNSLSECQYVFIIFSDASPKVMSGDTLIPRRPFPEMFNSAVGMIIAEINEITAREGISNGRERNTNANNTALKKFLVGRFQYSNPSCVPEFFNLLPCKTLVLPRDVGLLFGYLHGIDITHRTMLEHDADLTAINLGVSRYQQFVFNHPDWLDLRFEPKDLESPSIVGQSSQLPMRVDYDNETIDQIAAKYGLTVPEHDSDLENNDNERFKLIENTDDISSTSSSLN